MGGGWWGGGDGWVVRGGGWLVGCLWVVGGGGWGVCGNTVKVTRSLKYQTWEVLRLEMRHGHLETEPEF
jgi:hypothetical protein